MKGFNMPGTEYNELLDYLDAMISGGAKLIHSGHILNLSDTKIPALIKKIRKNNKSIIQLKLNPGDHVKHKISKQDMWVVIDDGKTIFLTTSLSERLIKYPLDKISNDFRLIKRARKIKRTQNK
jgi:hypothetical protein